MQKIQLISDFNIEVLARYLANDEDLNDLLIEVAPYSQVYQQLVAPAAANQSQQCAVIWARPEALLESFCKAISYQTVDHSIVLDELEHYIAALSVFCRRQNTVLHVAFALPPGYRGYGMLEYVPELGIKHLLARMNLRLAEMMRQQDNLFLLDIDRWLQAAGQRATIPKLWYASKTPFSNFLFEHAKVDIVAAIRGLVGRARKIIVIDLDNTLWGGIVGETGWQGIRLGGHDFVGEAYQDFQHKLKALTQRGVQLGIVSKNDEATALEAIDQHPEMVLRRADFAGWRINWQDKAQNLLDLIEELRLGADSVVFIDDNPVERARVREAIGNQVLVPDWPSEPSEYSNALMALTCFDTPAVSDEDRARARMYAAERERRRVRQTVSSVESWLGSLGTKVVLETLADVNLPRAAQLLNKTNQMNMATRRLSQDELRAWTTTENHLLWTVRVSDRFGDSGISGIISLNIGTDTTDIVDFLISCRVMGRQIEETMLHAAVEYLRAHGGIKKINAELIPTERNSPCREFWQRSGFTEIAENYFQWATERPYPKPSHIDLIVDAPP